MRQVSIICVGNDYYIEYRGEMEIQRSMKVRGGLESAVIYARDLVNAFINAGLNDGLEVAISLRTELQNKNESDITDTARSEK